MVKYHIVDSNSYRRSRIFEAQRRDYKSADYESSHLEKGGR